MGTGVTFTVPSEIDKLLPTFRAHHLCHLRNRDSDDGRVVGDGLVKSPYLGPWRVLHPAGLSKMFTCHDKMERVRTWRPITLVR